MQETGLREPEPRSALKELASDASSRKRFLKAAGGAGAGALSLLLAACGASKTQTTPGGSNPNTAPGLGTDMFGKGDAGIAGFALYLEYLESQFYAQAIASGLLRGRALQLAHAFQADEARHVQTLQSAVQALGGTPPPPPKTSFQLTSPATALQIASSMEAVGAAAYLGQAARIESKQLLATALTIHTVEARHSAALDELLGTDPSPDGAFAQAQAASDALDRLRPFIV